MGISAPKEFACAIIVDTHGRFLLQRRDNKPEIRHPGMIGLFGGHREMGETSLECLVREVQEEIGRHVPPENFEHIATYCQMEASGPYKVEIYAVVDVNVADLTIMEGTLLVARPEDLFDVMVEMEPSAVFALQTFLRRQEEI